MKSRVKKRVIALMLCMVMVLSSGISTLAEGDAGTPEATEEVSSTNDESAVNTEPDTAVAEDAQSRSNTAVETETAAEENAPAEAEAQPKTAEAAPAENTEADAAAQTPVEETQTEETKDNAADAQSTEQSAENGEAVQEETTTPETENETAQNTETAPQPYEGKYEDDTIKITVNAEAGIVPEGAELSVTPIEKTEITDDMTAEEKAEAEKINDQYDLTEKKLNEDSEENEETMEGFLAYDISFLVNGEEVEPNGDVNVVMEFKEAAIPEGVSEDAAVTVKHLKEDETAEDGVVVEDMADKAEVQTTEKAEVEKVELTADSFSVYTINWYYGNRQSSYTVKFHYVDTQGIDIQGKEGNIDRNEDSEIDLTSTDYEEVIGGYTHQYTTVESWSNDVKADRLRIKNVGNKRPDWKPQYHLAGADDSDDSWKELSGNFDYDEWEYTYDVYFVYEKNPSDITIEDAIKSEGLLRVNVNEELQASINEAQAAGQEVKYVWLKSEQGSDFSEVVLVKSGEKYNISEDGKALDVIIDKADKAKDTKYKVQLYIGDGATAVAESSEFVIPYYTKIQNESFETPKSDKANGMPVDEDTIRFGNQWSNELYKKYGGVWQTTGTEFINDQYGSYQADIEILNVEADGGQGSGDGFMYKAERAAKDGVQYAEINCEASGALYQDVLTDTQVDLNYFLSHRARSKNGQYDSTEDKFDTMYLVIMPTKDAESYQDHNALVNALNTHLDMWDEIPTVSAKNNSHSESATVLYNQDGLLIAKITSDASDWHDITVENIEKANGVEKTTYKPTSALSRFFFISGATYAGDDTIGNFVDAIGFGQVPLPAESGSISIEVQKTVTGLTEKQFEKLKETLSFEINATDPENPNQEVKNAPLNGQIIKASDREIQWNISEPDANGLITVTMSTKLSAELPNNEWNKTYLYKVTETGTDVEGTALQSTLDVRVTGGSLSGTDGAILGERDAATFDFTNAYISSEMDVSFTKVNESDAAIPNVKFALYQSEDSEQPIEGTEVTSDTNGIVTFKELDAGTYILRETETPQGYVKAGPWTITVGDPTGGYTITGTGVSGNSTDGYQIVNHSFSSSIDVDKSVKVVNYDERTYEITLSAKSILDSITQEGEPVDVVLVFDTSKSMDFPGNLSIVKKNVEVHDLSSSNTQGLDKDKTYYCIRKNSAATVYKLWFKNGNWVYTDASANNEIKVNASNSIFENGEKYDIYQADGTSTRLDYLKTAAKSFIDKLNTLSNENQVGLVTFAERANYKSDMVGLGALSDTYEDLTVLIEELNNNYTASGTNQADGLKKAVEMLENDQTTHEKYVILLTDGAPNWKANGHSVSNTECWTQITEQADKLKNNGVTLMTMGVGLTYVDAGIEASGSSDALASEKLKSIASTADGAPYYFNTDNASELESYFDSLFATIVSGIGIENVTVTDVIDPRFELVTQSIPESGQYDPDTGTITWSDVKLPYVSGDGAGWTVSFTIKAKEDFMGGNVIPTNGAASGVSGNGETVPFPQPAVNVKSLGLQVPSVEETIYLGDNVNAVANVEKIKEVLAEKIARDIADGESSTFVIPDGCQLTETEILALFNQQEQRVAKDYSYGSTNDVVGQFVYSLEVAATMKPESSSYDSNGYPSTAVGDDKELYKLKVQYVPVNIDDRKPGDYVYNAGDTDTYGAASEQTSSEGTYTLNVIAGSIEIIKKLNNDEISTEPQTFNFIVSPSGGTEDDKIEVSITVEANATEGSLTEENKVKLSNLKRGDWTVEEVPASGYSVAEVTEGEGNNTKYVSNNQKITFTMGTSESGTNTLEIPNYTEGIRGVAEFTNERVTTNWQFVKVSSTDNTITLPDARFKLESPTPEPDGTTYYGESDTNGVIKWYENENCSGYPIANSNLKPGTYTLTESTAPSGYVKSEESWTVEITSNGIRSVAVTGSDDTIETFTGEDGTVSYYFKNEVLYDLPESGGTGIYWYMLGGVLLMMAGSLLVYKKRRGEVLRRK